MGITSTIILSLTTCIDSFILCLLNKNKTKLNYLITPFIFAFFQITFMLTGYFLGDFIEEHLHNHLKHFTFIIFSAMAIKLILDILINKGKEKTCCFAIKDIILQALTASFDSLFLGLPLAFKSNTYIIFILIIGLTTFFICFLGLLLRNKFKNNFEEKIGLIGAIVLFMFAFKNLI